MADDINSLKTIFDIIGDVDNNKGFSEFQKVVFSFLYGRMLSDANLDSIYESINYTDELDLKVYMDCYLGYSSKKWNKHYGFKSHNNTWFNEFDYDHFFGLDSHLPPVETYVNVGNDHFVLVEPQHIISAIDYCDSHDLYKSEYMVKRVNREILTGNVDNFYEALTSLLPQKCENNNKIINSK